jgi:hypothetical protein
MRNFLYKDFLFLCVLLGAGCLAVLWATGGGWAFWCATVSFWVSCVLTLQLEEPNDERPPDLSVTLHFVCLGVTAAFGAFGLLRWFIG